MLDRPHSQTDALLASWPSTMDTEGDAEKMRAMVVLARELERHSGPDLATLLADYFAAYPFGKLGDRYRAIRDAAPKSGGQRAALIKAISLCVVRVGGRELSDTERGEILDALRGESSGPADDGWNAALEAAARLIEVEFAPSKDDHRRLQIYAGHLRAMKRPAATEDSSK